MAVNKVVYGGTVLIDTSGVTVDAEHLMSGYTALDASGALITGVATGTDEWTSGIYQDSNGFIRISPNGGAAGFSLASNYLVAST